MDEPTDLDKFASLVRRDKTATVMLAIALFLILSMMLATAVARAWDSVAPGCWQSCLG